MNTEVDLCGIKMKNPVTVASGTLDMEENIQNI